jgi:hypothetical protein
MDEDKDPADVIGTPEWEDRRWHEERAVEAKTREAQPKTITVTVSLGGHREGIYSVTLKDKKSVERALSAIREQVHQMLQQWS